MCNSSTESMAERILQIDCMMQCFENVWRQLKRTTGQMHIKQDSCVQDVLGQAQQATTQCVRNLCIAMLLKGLQESRGRRSNGDHAEHLV